jgi:3-isopropylmalate/(R)-2-methylmalate dehydratase small subunit
MERFNALTGLVAPLDRANVDTDQIIPKQYLKSIRRTGFGPNLFDAWRYLDHGEPGMDHAKRPLNPDFVLNRERYRGAAILLARKNFGCGSSREHAPWALLDYGFRCVIAPSFADIFAANAVNNGIAPIALPDASVTEVARRAGERKDYRLRVDLEALRITDDDGLEVGFEFDPFRRRRLLEGLDEISLTLEYEAAIAAFERRRERWHARLEPR